MFSSNISSKVVGFSSLVSFFSPLVALAQGSAPVTSVDSALEVAKALITQVTPFIIGLGVFVILFGVFRYVVQADNEEARKSGQKFIFWGVIGVFVMISIWGLVNILVGTVPLDTTPGESPELFPQ